MQFIAGDDLAEIISKQPGHCRATRSLHGRINYLMRLVYLHTRDRQIIHRDIKTA
jgi:serine/threonine protein kinase